MRSRKNCLESAGAPGFRLFSFVTEKETKPHPENIKVRGVVIHRARLASPRNGRSDKSFLSGGRPERSYRVRTLSRPVTRPVMSL